MIVMKGMVLVLLALIGIASFSFAAVNMSLLDSRETKNNENIKKIEDEKILEFSTFTSAVCESNAGAVHCKDELFVNCNGNISKASDAAECNGLSLDVPKASGFAVFANDWKDP